MKDLIQDIEDFILLLLFIVRYLLHGCERFPLRKSSLYGIDILGNGPSLRQYIENGYKTGRDSLCVNFSPLTDEFYKVHPKYLVLIDQIFYDEKNEKTKELRAAIHKRIDWNLKIITFQSNLKTAKKIYGGNNINFIGLPQISYNPQTDYFKKIRNVLFKWGMTMPSAQNVVIAAIFFSINEGYKNINLYGVEHSWLKDTYVTSDNMVCLKDSHYYGTEKIPWSYNEDGTTWKMSQVLYALYHVFKGYDELQQYANYLGRIIIDNKTSDSWIDAFEKVQTS